MKRFTALAAAVMLLCTLILTGCGGGGSTGGSAGSSNKTLTLNVYNWGEYISDGSEDSFNTVREFEKWYEETYKQKVKVNYTTFASNEDMYAKLSSGAVSFDVVIPSDYMIARMREENMLLELDFNNIPNYQNIDESFRSLYYDPDNKYTVPYTYGVVGVIYNANAVDEADVGGWDLLWNDKYKGNILQFNNPRDAFGTAQFKLGLDPNDTDHASWDAALAELKKQAPLVKSYVMDEIYNMMESGEAAIGVYYAGDYFTMLSPEPAIANAEFIYYATPNSVVYKDEGYIEEMGEEAMEILYPDIENFSALYNEYAFRSLDQAMLDYVNSLWETLKIN